MGRFAVLDVAERCERAPNNIAEGMGLVFSCFCLVEDSSNQSCFAQISPCSVKVNESSLQTTIINLNHVPTKASWDLAVTKALQMIKGRQRELVKVSHSLTFQFSPIGVQIKRHNWHYQ